MKRFLPSVWFQPAVLPFVKALVIFLYTSAFLPLCALKARAQLLTNVPGLVSLWAADGNSSDSAGTNHGVIQGTVQFGLGKIGTAFSFDGSGGSVLVTNNPTLQLLQESTLMAWINLDQLPSELGQFLYIAGRSERGNDFDLEVEADNRARYYPCGGAGGGGYPGSSTVLRSGIWYHLAATYRAGERMALFVNGIQEVNLAIGCTLGGNANSFSIGLSPIWGRPFHGRIDQVRLYNRALSSQEVQTIYAAEAGSTGLPLLRIRVSQVELSWETEPGVAFLLQYSSELTPGIWVPVSTNPIVGTGAMFRTNEVIQSDEPRKYYRLVPAKGGSSN